jgi:hypothetical protein
MSSCGCGAGLNHSVDGGGRKAPKQIKRWAEGKLTRVELIEHAKKHMIPYYSKLSKEQLEKAIKKARNIKK